MARREAHPKLQVLAPKLVTFRLGNGLAGAENCGHQEQPPTHWELGLQTYVLLCSKSLGAPRTRTRSRSDGCVLMPGEDAVLLDACRSPPDVRAPHVRACPIDSKALGARALRTFSDSSEVR